MEGFSGLQYVIDLEKKLHASAAAISDVFMNSTMSSRKSLSKLVRESLYLNQIDERIDALKGSGGWFDAQFRKDFQSRIIGLENAFFNLRNKIQKRRDQSHDEVQLVHLSWTKKNAWFIVLLTVSQILIALVSVDWSESGRDKNNLLVNWQSISSFFR
jgi:hypothetical protein